MPAADLRSWIDLLKREGELVEVEAEVDPYLEITEIVDRVVKSGGPALLFRNVKGSERPLLINQFGTERRMCLAFGSRPSTTSRASSRTCSMQPPQGLVEKVKGLGKLSGSPTRCRRRSRGAPARSSCSSPTSTRSDPALLAGRPGAVHHAPGRDHEDPRTGVRNVGMYRMQKIDARSTYMHWQIHKDGRADWLAAEGSIPVAVALGLDPITAYSASAP